MPKLHRISVVLIACFITGIVVQTTHAANQTSSTNSAATVAGIGNCPLFPADNAWNRDVSNDPIDPNSNNYIASINATTTNGSSQFIRAGFGLYPEYGIPYVVVPGTQPKVPITFNAYGSQSDPGPYPVPANAPVEGAGIVASDKHVIVVDKDNCKLYEMYNAAYNGTGWTANAGAVYDLNSDALRPDGWTSADAAGMPVFPGLIRYDEVATGVINHALRFTVGASQKKYIAPARHFQSQDTNPNLPPMGMRVRLKKSFDISGYSGPARVILQALKTYGMFVADEGGPWYMTGTADSRWDRNSLETLRTVPGDAFEVINTGLNTVALSAGTATPAGTSTPIPGGFNGFKVQYRPGETNVGDDQIHPYLNLLNRSGADVALSQFKIRYWFTRDTAQNISAACDWAALNCANITLNPVVMAAPITGADAYLEVGFTAGAGNLGDGWATQDINLRINKADWSNFNETNDYSFDATKTAYDDWTRVTLYRNGQLIWGVEPTNVLGSVATNTSVPPTATQANTPIPATIIPTNTAIPATVAPSGSNITYWVDDALPAGATVTGTWNWVSSSPSPYTGTKANQSTVAAGAHQHYFTGATAPLQVNTGDYLIASVYIDPANTPSEIMLQWNDGTGWEHRAYWGSNNIVWGTDGTNSRRYQGVMPAAGHWVLLQVPASQLGLQGIAVKGMAFVEYNGRATWDSAGKSKVMLVVAAALPTNTAIPAAATKINTPIPATVAPTKTAVPATATKTNTPIPATIAPTKTSTPIPATVAPSGTNPVYWVDESLPAGAVTAGNEAWTWVTSSPASHTGTKSHQSIIAAGPHQHYFTGATTPLQINTNDYLIASVYIDPATKPSEIMIQWFDGAGWEHRAYWGSNSIAYGTDGTNSRRYQGVLPAAGQWVLLQVPASQLGLQGVAVKGMAFVEYNGRATWDSAGKSNVLLAVPATAVPANTAIPATATKVNTPVPATIAPTNTAVPATATKVNTPVPTVASAAQLKVQYRPGDPTVGDNMVKPFFNIVNAGGTAVPLSEITLRYWFTRDTAQAVTYACDWSVIGCANVSGKVVILPSAFVGADAYLEIGFPTSAGSVGAMSQTSDIQVRMNKADWSNFNESNDYSFDTTAYPDLTKIVFKDWSKVTLYRNGQLIWGAQPNVLATVNSAALAPSTLAPTTAPLPTNTLAPTKTLVPPTATLQPTVQFVPPTNTAVPPTTAPVIAPTGSGG